MTTLLHAPARVTLNFASIAELADRLAEVLSPYEMGQLAYHAEVIARDDDAFWGDEDDAPADFEDFGPSEADDNGLALLRALEDGAEYHDDIEVPLEHIEASAPFDYDAPAWVEQPADAGHMTDADVAIVGAV